MKIKCTFLIVMIIVSCQPKTQPVNTVAAKVEVNNFMDTYMKLWNAKDANSLTTLLAEDGLFCGTDPSEIMDTKTMTDAWTKMMADTSFVISYTVDKREIRVAPDGNSAIIMEQFTPGYTPKLPWRIVSHAVKTGDIWKLDFISWNMIPKNEDIDKLNIALQ